MPTPVTAFQALPQATPVPANPTPAPPAGPPAPAPGIAAPAPGAPVDCSACTEEAPPPSPFDWSKFKLGGQFRIEADGANFTYHSPVITDRQDDQFVVIQRYRLWLTYNPNDHVEGYIQMQIGGVAWGTNFDFNKNFPADFSPVPGDRVGIELRRAWLAYKDDNWGKFRAGILDWHDYFHDTLASSDYDFNVGGVEWTNTIKDWNDFKYRLAILLLSDEAFIANDVSPGSHSAYLYAFDADQPFSKTTSVGASIYFLNDRDQYSYPTFTLYSSAWDLWFGVRGNTKLGEVPISGLFLVNAGERKDFTPDNFNHTGYAGLVEVGPIPFGKGKFSTQFVASSGGSTPGEGATTEFRTLAQTARDNFGSQGYWSYMHILTPNGPDDVNDLGVSLQDRGLGLFTIQAKYEYPLTCKLLSTTAAGWFRSQRANPTSGSSDIGTELSQMFTYNFGGGLTLDTGAAVLFTGNFYRSAPNGPTPDDLFEIFARLQLEF
jgi:hypothetical protein